LFTPEARAGKLLRSPEPLPQKSFEVSTKEKGGERGQKKRGKAAYLQSDQIKELRAP